MDERMMKFDEIQEKKGFKCVICEDWAIGWGSNKQYGHNPQPLSSHGECCDKCNELVIIARLKQVQKEGKE